MVRVTDVKISARSYTDLGKKSENMRKKPMILRLYECLSICGPKFIRFKHCNNVVNIIYTKFQTKAKVAGIVYSCIQALSRV